MVSGVMFCIHIHVYKTRGRESPGCGDKRPGCDGNVLGVKQCPGCS